MSANQGGFFSRCASHECPEDARDANVVYYSLTDCATFAVRVL
ncbi:hypothetical protein COLSTE_00509 [Collinsella stercoris DSM 13279]|uniref:Uncharacterized protein n=1 Tax=Collinsella stercoris DSM 13279 TaxID=445975 RepID=B6G8W8_9ACTN|nr:hypothetical protein COLSTE_00509 [Collinsella stercoris DSM 13279]